MLKTTPTDQMLFQNHWRGLAEEERLHRWHLPWRGHGACRAWGRVLHHGWLEQVGRQNRSQQVSRLQDGILSENISQLTWPKKSVSFFSEKDEYKDYRFVKWLSKNRKLQGIPPSAFFSKEHKGIGENYIRFCFIKVRQICSKTTIIKDRHFEEETNKKYFFWD